MEGGDESIHYAKLPDSIITAGIKDDAIRTKGYFIYPSQLFANVVAQANTNQNLNTDLAAIFSAIESSATGYPSEQDIKGLFADFDTTSNRLGSTVAEKNNRLAAVLKGVADLDFGDFEGNHIDLFGDAYEFLISNYAANAGKSGGEFFTPQHVSRLIARLATHGQKRVNKIYDPACGSGSLLLQARKLFDERFVEDGYFGQEINHTTYNLARMNMFLHNINYDKFDIRLGDTLTNPQFDKDKPFDAIVSNPPYSVRWIGMDDPTLINDERFAPAGVLAPKSKADFAFVLHALNYLSGKGRAAIVCFPGIFYRGGAEQKIRQYLVDNNYVETVISLAPNLFFGTSIAVNILVLSKHKTDTLIQFIDASGLFKKETTNNVLLDAHIEQIVQAFERKADIDHFAKSVTMEKVTTNDYNLSVSSYVEAKDTREVVDIDKLNAELKNTVARIDQLRKEIDAIVAEIESKTISQIIFSQLSGPANNLNSGNIEYKKISEFSRVLRGKRLTKNLLASEGKYPVFHGGIEPLGFFDNFNRKENTVMVINVGASAGSVGFCDQKFWSSDGCFCLDHSEIVDNKYLYFAVSQQESYLKSRVRVAGIPTLHNSVLENLVIPIPPLPVQKRIARILDNFETLTNSITEGLPHEIALRQKQYEYYRDLLFSFPKPQEVA